MLKIIGLADGNYDLLSVGAVREIKAADAVVLQSDKALCAAQIRQEAKEFHTLDEFFEQASDFDELYRKSGDFIAELSAKKKVVFGALGNLHSNGFVAALKTRTEFAVIPGASLESAAQCVADKYMETEAFQSVDARNIRNVGLDSASALIVTGMDNPLLASGVKLHMTGYYDDETSVVFINGGDHKLIPICDLDQQKDYGIGSIAVFPPLKKTQRTRYTFGDLVEIMEKLRGPGGCPWDLEQTHETLRQYVLEEAYEVVHAVDTKDPAALADELGDLMLQVVFHAQIGAQRGEFDITDVISNICSKMILRHPHIFGSVSVGGAEEVVTNWEAIKRNEKGLSTYTQTMEDIPSGMSALMRAAKIQKKAAQAGFDWEKASDAFEKVKEEVFEFEQEIRNARPDEMENEAGDLLFSCVNVLRLMKINPEVALTRTIQKFISRFNFIEQNAGDDLKNLTLKQLDCLWEDAKRQGM
jgi:tetrapyrrole methylase family protein/MazG family protein